MKAVLTRAAALLVVAMIVMGLAACGGDDSSGGDEELTPEVAMERLQEDGYVTGEIITNGANMGVARNGNLDAEAYLGVDSDPDGNRLYAGLYFFKNEADAAVLAEEWERPDSDSGSYSEQVGSIVYNIAGPQQDLTPVIDSAEAE